MSTTVVLTTNTAGGITYWRLQWVCPKTGRRRTQQLGRADKMSRRDANLRRAKREAEFILEPSAAGVSRAPKLLDWCRKVAEVRGKDDGPRTNRALYLQTLAHLEEAIGNPRLDELDHRHATRFLEHLRAAQTRGGSELSETTIRNHCRRAYTMYQDAARAQFAPKHNPFEPLPRTPSKSNPERHVTVEEIERVIATEPDPRWRMLYALCRYGALRLGEASRLRWEDVDLAAGRMTVRNTERVETTKKRSRVVPIVPRLAEILAEHRVGSDLVTDGAGGHTGNANRRLRGMAAKAGIEPWARAHNTLRASGITDFATEVDAPTVARWCGNSIEVIMEHYFQDREDKMDRIAGKRGSRTTERLAEMIAALDPEQARTVQSLLVEKFSGEKKAQSEAQAGADDEGNSRKARVSSNLRA